MQPRCSEMADAADDVAPPSDARTAACYTNRVWVERLQLTDFRNYAGLSLSVGPAPVVLTGANGSGKTNLLEALSLLDLRPGPAPRALSGAGAHGRRPGWAVAARLARRIGGVDIGTGLSPQRTPAAQRPRRAHRRRDAGRLRRARRARRDGLADAGHGRPVHRARRPSAAASSTG